MGFYLALAPRRPIVLNQQLYRSYLFIRILRVQLDWMTLIRLAPRYVVNGTAPGLTKPPMKGQLIRRLVLLLPSLDAKVPESSLPTC